MELKCPRCHQADEIDVWAMVWVRLTPVGTDADLSRVGDHEWDKRSPATCACGWEGLVRDLC